MLVNSNSFSSFFFDKKFDQQSISLVSIFFEDCNLKEKVKRKSNFIYCIMLYFLKCFIDFDYFWIWQKCDFCANQVESGKTDEARKIISPVGQTANRVRDKKLLSQLHSYIHTCIADIKINKYVCACVCVKYRYLHPKAEWKNAFMLCTKIVQFTFKYNFHYGQFTHRFPLTISEIYRKAKRIRRYLKTKFVCLCVWV